MKPDPSEIHRGSRTGWLRAAVLGANDGILSTASLIVGVAAAHATHQDILITGMAGLVAGAMSMAAGEYVSVSSQVDAEKADLEKERIELATDIKSEGRELASIYVGRGLTPELASQVADQLMARDALEAHARDELGLSSIAKPRPVQAALASAASFSLGAALPLLMVFAAPIKVLVPTIFVVSLACLALLGAWAARTGGAKVLRGALRVTFWGALAMGLTMAVGAYFGATT